MYMVPQEGDRIQEIGQDPKKGVLLEVHWDTFMNTEAATVLWDGKDEPSVILYDYIEAEAWV